MPRNFHIIHSILNESWFINLNYNIDQLNVIIDSVMNPNIVAEANTESFEPQVSGRVSVIPIVGVLTKYDGVCGTPGMQSYGEIIQRAIKDSSIDAIVLSVDSPGGQVNGTEALADIIASSTKPIVGYVDDVGCSAAYRILSPCSSIVANNPLAVVGSIGVMATYTDLTAANEKRGVKVHQVYAPQSTHKNKVTRDLESGDSTSLEAELGVYADQFITAVKKHRPNVAAEHLNGSTFFAKDAMGTLIDSIGSIDSAISTALSLSKSKSTKKMTNKTPRMASALGVDALESIDGSVTLTQEQAETLESTITQYEASVTELNTARDTAVADLATANTTITTLTAERDALKVRVSELKKAPAATPSAISIPTDGLGLPTTSMSQKSAEEEAKKYL